MKYRINYTKVISQAQSIDNSATELSALVRQLENMEVDCRAAWKGQTADVFTNKLNTLISEMKSTRRQMTNLASTIRTCAERIENEDRRLEELAESLATDIK